MNNTTDGKTVNDIFETLTEDQKQVVYFLLGQAIESGGDNTDTPVTHSIENRSVQLEHHGVLGMHWGRRKGITSTIARAGRMRKNSLTHPILEPHINKVTEKIGSTRSKLVATGRKHLLANVKKAVNPAEHIAAVKEYAHSMVKTASEKPLASWLKEAHQTTKNSVMHPILTNKADIASKQAGSTKEKFMRTLVYQNTKNLKDVNRRTAKLIADKKAVR